MNKLVLLLVVLSFVSCGENDPIEQPEIKWNQKKSSQLNKDLMMEQEIEIQLFLEQHKDWKIEKSGSGLQYYIYEKGNGELAQEGMTAEVEMSVSLLDGTECYKTNSDEYEEFVIDKSDIESGIQEGVKKMKVGDRSKMIIPSHIAHGLVGDLDKIPPLTVIVVDIHLIGLIK